MRERTRGDRKGFSKRKGWKSRGLPAFPLAHRWLLYHDCMLWKHYVATVHSSLSRGIVVLTLDLSLSIFFFFFFILKKSSSHAMPYVSGFYFLVVFS